MAARLFLYRGPSKYSLTGIDDEYTIECLEGDAFGFLPKTWLAVGLEVGGKVTPFAASDQVTMKVFDERDTEVGARMILERTSAKPYKDGFHYFKALEWRQVGAYRITFKLARRVLSAAPPPPPLTFVVTISDPSWEHGMYELLAAEAEAAVEQELRDQARRAGYAFAPLTERERAWLGTHAGDLPKDPPAAVLAELAARMASALGGSSSSAGGGRVKDPSVLAPLFESEAGAQRRLAVERLHKEAMKRQRVLESQRTLLAGGGRAAARGGGGVAAAAASGEGAAAPPAAASAAGARALFERLMRGGGGAASADPCAATAPPAPLSGSARRRKAAAPPPVSLAGPASYAAAVQAAEAFRVGGAAALAAASSDCGGGTGAAPPRMHRFEALPAEATLTLWSARDAAAGVLQSWGAAAALELRAASERAAAELRMSAGDTPPSSSAAAAAATGEGALLDAEGGGSCWHLLLRSGLGAGGGSSGGGAMRDLAAGGGHARALLAQLLEGLPAAPQQPLPAPTDPAAAAGAATPSGRSLKRPRL